MDVSVVFAGVARLAELLRSREVSSRELTELFLSRIERLEPQLNCFRVVLGERALAAADEADGRLGSGAEAPLLGVPLAVKDTLDLAEEVTAFGTAAYDRPAAADGELARRLRAAGAVILGKTNLPELAICGFTESKSWGIARNPWNPGLTPGGSSGGSGAAVAAGLAAAAHGSDGAGSIRIPAANCGLFGLKPQRGRVPIEPADHWRGMSVNGFLTRSVLDTAVLLDVATAGGAAGAPYVDAARRAPGRLHVAISTRPVRAVAPPIVREEVAGAVRECAGLLRSLGHEVAHEDPAYGQAGNSITTRYLAGIHDDVQAVPHPERLEARTRGFGRLGALCPRRLVDSAVRAAAKDAARVNRIFDAHDVLVTPVAGEPPIEVGRWEGKGALRTLLGMSRTYPFTPLWNHTGQPAAAVPMGFTDDGLPLSVQLIGPPDREDLLLSLAAQIEAERPWAARLPGVS
jgi:amidase